jgi:hypothetical protein
MSQSQKRLVIVLASATVVVIVALAWYVTSSLKALSSALPTAVPQTETPTRERPRQPTGEAPTIGASPLDACQWEAVQLMAEAGLGGTATLASGGVLRFEVVYALSPGEPADAAAQLVWTAFDVALVLADGECGDFTQMEVSVLAQSSQGDTRISASVSAADLIAYGGGDLSEDELIHRVVYQVSDE